jgi:hypothetical protein
MTSAYVRSLILGVILALTCGAAQCESAPRYPGVKLMVVIREVHLTRLVPDPAAETEVIKQFVEAGYTVIDQAQYAALRNSRDLDAILRNPLGVEAREMMARYGADIAILGEAFSELNTQYRGPGVSCRARVEVRAVSRQDARIVSITDGQGSGGDATEMVAGKLALRQAASHVAEYLLKGIGKATGGPTSASQADRTSQSDDSAEATSEPEGLPKLAVLPLDDRSKWHCEGGELGRQVPSLINAALGNVVEGYYELVDSLDYDQIVGEQLQQISGFYDNAGGSSELGTLVPARYAIIGRLDALTTKTKSAGGGLGDVLRGITGIQVKVDEEVATARVSLKLLDIKTGRIVGNKTCTGVGTASETAFSGGYGSIRIDSGEFEGTAPGKALRQAVLNAVAQIPCACPQCHKLISLGDKWCTGCGCRRAVAAQPAVCPSCKTKIPSGAAFCPGCGIAVHK